MPDKQYLFSFYVPRDDLETVLDAVFSAGAGKYKNYDRCAWTTLGRGRFRPLEKSDPYIGKQNEESKVNEIKVECLVKEENIQSVKDALLRSHPYEEPAYHFIVINVI